MKSKDEVLKALEANKVLGVKLMGNNGELQGGLLVPFRLGSICTVYIITLRSSEKDVRTTAFVDEGFTQSILPSAITDFTGANIGKNDTDLVIDSAMQNDIETGFFENVMSIDSERSFFRLKDTGKITRGYVQRTTDSVAADPSKLLN